MQPGESPEGENDTIRDEIARWVDESPGDSSAAVAHLTSLARVHPSSPEVLLALSLALTRAERPAPAAEALRRARFLAPNLANWLPRNTAASAAPGEGELLDALQSLLSAEATVGSGEYTLESVRELLPAVPAVEAPARPRPVQSDPVAAERENAPAGAASPLAKGPASGLRPPPAGQGRHGAMEPKIPGHPYGAPVELPDGWMLGRIALELWVRRFGVWAGPLVVTNLIVALAVPDSLVPLGQALAWLAAFAFAAPFTLRGMAREWSEGGEAEGVRKRSVASIVWAPLGLLAVGGSVLALLSLRLRIQGEELFALGMLVSLPLLALLAPVCVAWVTGQAGLGSGLKTVRASLSRRGLAYIGVMTAVGGLGGVVLGALGWGFLVTLRLVDSVWIRAVTGAMMSLPESLLLALIASIGLDAQAANGALEPSSQGSGDLAKAV